MHSYWYGLERERKAPAEAAECSLDEFPAISAQQFHKQTV